MNKHSTWVLQALFEVQQVVAQSISGRTPLLILGNLVWLLEYCRHDIKLLNPYSTAMLALLSSSSDSMIQSTNDSDVGNAVRSITEERHVRLLLVEAATLMASCDKSIPMCQSPFYASISAYAILSQKLSRVSGADVNPRVLRDSSVM